MKIILFVLWYGLKIQYKNCFNQSITLDNNNILFLYRREIMKIIINGSSMVPIYEQIIDQVKAMIVNGELKENDVLPSVRTLARELKISALTVKKAYDHLEQEGFTITVHGKGTYVAAANKEVLKEEHQKEIETDLEMVIQKGKRCGLKNEEIRELFDSIIGGERHECFR